MDTTASIAKWQNNAKAAFALYYDDGCNSVMDIVIPCLRKYNIPGTFYLCTGWYKDKEWELQRWFDQADDKIVFIGNHSVGHCGAKTLKIVEEEICNNDKVLRDGLKYPAKKMLSYGRPGGCCWNATIEEEKVILDSVNTLRREGMKPDGSEYAGGLSIKSYDDAKNALDAIEASGNNDYIIFHGVGGDWFYFPALDHELLVQDIATRKAKGNLWVAASVDIHKYITERDNASLKVLSTDNDEEIKLELYVGTDPESFDTPLSIVVDVPEEWLVAKLCQGNVSYAVPIMDGKVCFNVAPVNGEIIITKR